MGETDLVVRFDGAVVHLNDVVELEEMSYPLLFRDLLFSKREFSHQRL